MVSALHHEWKQKTIVTFAVQNTIIETQLLAGFPRVDRNSTVTLKYTHARRQKSLSEYARQHLQLLRNKRVKTEMFCCLVVRQYQSSVYLQLLHYNFCNVSSHAIFCQVKDVKLLV